MNSMNTCVYILMLYNIMYVIVFCVLFAICLFCLFNSICKNPSWHENPQYNLCELWGAERFARVVVSEQAAYATASNCQTAASGSVAKAEASGKLRQLMSQRHMYIYICLYTNDLQDYMIVFCGLFSVGRKVITARSSWKHVCQSQ